MKKIFATILLPAILAIVIFKLLFRKTVPTMSAPSGSTSLNQVFPYIQDPGLPTIQIGDSILASTGKNTTELPGSVTQQIPIESSFIKDLVVKMPPAIDYGTMAGTVVLKKTADYVVGDPVVSKNTVINPANTPAEQPKSATPVNPVAVAPVVSSKSNEIVTPKVTIIDPRSIIVPRSRPVPLPVNPLTGGGGLGIGTTPTRGVK